VRYILYPTAEEARRRWIAEDFMERQVGPVPGSYTGVAIGEQCESLALPESGIYELHFVRANVSVCICAHVSVSSRARNETDKAVYRSDIQESLEATAQAIVRRIDAVVRAKGRVDVTNLPPVQTKSQPTRP
jgi:hypothetical protein